MDPQACRERFARHLTAEVELLSRLEQQLQHEHELLVANDVESLEKVSSTRQQTVANLLRVHEERGALCRARRLAADPAGFAKLLEWCDPQGTLADAQTHCATQAERCREQNERNGALVMARLNRIGSMLGMLTADSGSATYHPRTAVRSRTFESAGTMLTTRA